VLLGNVACALPGQRLTYDGPNMKVTNNEDANRLIQHHYRAGWSL
jgi:hypothetical protein